MPRGSFERIKNMPLALLLPCMVMTAGSAFAQTDIPPTADPARVPKVLSSPPALQPPEEEDARRTVVAQPPEGADQLRFTLRSVRIEGMSAYDESEVRGLYAAYIGREVSVATIFEISAALQQKYIDDGYTLTRVVIPNQNIEEGDVSLRVIEGSVREFELNGDFPPSRAITDARARIMAMQPLNVKTLERIVLLLNDLPDLNVSAVLARPTGEAAAEEGALRMVLQKNEEVEARGRVSIDNTGSVFTGPWQGTVNGRLFHIGPHYSEVNVSAAATTQFVEQRYVAGSYILPLFGISGTKLTVTSVLSRTEPGGSLDELDIKGGSQTFAAMLSYPIIRERAESWSISGGVEAKNARTKLLGDEIYDDRLRNARAATHYSFSDAWYGYNAFGLDFVQGFDVLGARETGSVNLSREDGHSDFSKFEFSAGRLQALPHDFEIYAMMTGQYAFDPLLSSEEFGFGGVQGGRGYDPSEITGDHGLSLTLEARYNFYDTYGPLDLSFQPYFFFDIGSVWNIDSGAEDQVSAASAGVGLRLNVDQVWEGNFVVAAPLTRPADNPPKYTDEDGIRVLFSLSRSF